LLKKGWMKALNLTIQMLKLNAAVASRLQSNFSILNDAIHLRVFLVKCINAL
jgi:hypothetical protein